MNRFRVFLSVGLLSVLCLTGCSGGSTVDSGSAVASGVAGDYSDSYMAEKSEVAMNDGMDMSAESNIDGDMAVDTTDVGSQTNPNVNKQAKRIYRGNLSIETTKFVKTQDHLYDCIEKVDAYLESDTTNKSQAYFSEENDLYYGNMTVRVPAEKFEDLLSMIEDCEDCVISDKSIQTDDISETYYDVQGRLKSYKTKLKKLQGLLADAENITEVLDIENAITSTQYEIESLQGQLNSYDSQVRYSVLDIRLEEVNVLDMSNHVAGYGSKLKASISKGFYSGINFISNLILFVLQGWLLFVLFGGIIFVIYKKTQPKRMAKRAEVQAQRKEAEAVRKILIDGASDMNGSCVNSGYDVPQPPQDIYPGDVGANDGQDDLD